MMPISLDVISAILFVVGITSFYNRFDSGTNSEKVAEESLGENRDRLLGLMTYLA